MKKIAFLSLCILILSVQPINAATHTLEECIAIAVEKHPTLVKAKAKIDSLKAVESQMASDGRLQATLNSGYEKTGSSKNDTTTPGPYETSVTATQSLYDWGKRDLKVKSAKSNTSSAVMDYITQKDIVISDVRTSYYSLNKAGREKTIAEERYKNYQNRLKWAKTYYQVGTKPKIEMTKAESDLANAKLTLVKSQASIEQARASLAAAMGLPLIEIEKMTDVLEISDKEIQIKEAIELALSQKGSILSQKKKIEYQKFTLDLTKKGMTPDVTASAGYSVYGENSLDDNGWNARVTLSMPLIDGGLTKSKIQSASKDLTSAEAEMQNIENDVKLSVRKSWYALKEAKELLVSSKEAEKVAKETLDLALERYKTGVGNSLEVSDAVDSFALAQTNTVTAMYQCKQSHLELELSIGGLELEAK